MIGRALRTLSQRMAGSSVGLSAWLAWHAAGFVLVLTLPTHVELRQPSWSPPQHFATQTWAWAAAFLAVALLLSALRRADRLSVVTAVIACGLGFGAALGFMETRPEGYYRSIGAVSILLGGALAVGPYFLGKATLPLSLLPVLAAAWVTNAALSYTPIITSEERLVTTFHTVDVTTYIERLDSTEIRGGAVEAYGDGFLLVTGSGEFFEFGPEIDAERLKAGALDLRVPMNRDAYLAARPGGPIQRLLRVTDLLIDEAGDRVIVAHQYWNDAESCTRMRVSAAPLGSADATWETLFESHPCLAYAQSWDDWEAGGRMAWLPDGSFLVTMGDHGLDGQPGEAAAGQDSTVSYGKIFRVSPDGEASVYSTGHRNPQGLVVAADGRIWSTEHGPEGGDEINVVAEGANYGWPVVSYGAKYGMDSWPPAGDLRNHGDFSEPAHVFIPSIAVSNIIQVGGAQFAQWEGDFLIASLKVAGGLYRMRARDASVRFLEPIPIGSHVRDLTELADGRVVVWTGERIMVVERAEISAGEAAYASCASCHGTDLEGGEGGPSIRGVLTKGVATVHAGYPYSEALQSVGGFWDRARLDAFLADPAGFAPGNSMVFPGIEDEATRTALIDYLELNK